MAKHLTVALLISGLVFSTGTAHAGQKKHAHPVKHDMHKVNQAQHNVHKDHQALKHDYSQQHQARQTLQSDWKRSKPTRHPATRPSYRRIDSNSSRTGSSTVRIALKPKPTGNSCRRTATNCGMTSGN